MFQIEGRNAPDAPWVRYPVQFTRRAEVEHALEHLQATSPAGWPEYRIAAVDADPGDASAR